MRVFRGFDALPGFRHAVVTTGSFDGVHRGHRMLLDRVRAAADERGGESVVLTLEPHPRIFFGDGDMRLLTTLDEKIALLEQTGVDNLIVMPFDMNFSRQTACGFIADCIVERIGAEQLTVGYNHRFGHDRQGGAEFLEEAGRRFGIAVEEVSCYDAEGDKVSSTMIRRAVGEGRMETASRLAGHPYIIIGMARGGCVDSLSEYKLLPPDGEYRATVGDGESTAHICGRKILLDKDLNGLIEIKL